MVGRTQSAHGGIELADRDLCGGSRVAQTRIMPAKGGDGHLEIGATLCDAGRVVLRALVRSPWDSHGGQFGAKPRVGANQRFLAGGFNFAAHRPGEPEQYHRQCRRQHDHELLAVRLGDSQPLEQLL